MDSRFGCRIAELEKFGDVAESSFQGAGPGREGKKHLFISSTLSTLFAFLILRAMQVY
jgi:hypothetical protein